MFSSHFFLLFTVDVTKMVIIDFQLLTVILAKATRQNTLDDAIDNLFNPFGINEYEWVKDADGYPYGPAHLRILPGDMFKFGNLILNQGRYKGKKIVPSSYVSTPYWAKRFTKTDKSFFQNMTV